MQIPSVSPSHCIVRVATIALLGVPIAASFPIFAPVGFAQAASPAVKLDPERLQQALDRGDIADAVQQVELGWKAQYEAYWQGEFTTRLASMNEIQRILRNFNQQTGQKTALIYAVPTKQHLELIAITADGQPVHRRVVAANRQQLDRTADALRSHITTPETTQASYLPPAQTLYQWLIGPLESELKARNITHLMFCLGTGLRSLPLAALQDGHQFLVEKYSLGIIPAFNLLDVQRSTLPRSQILAMGASEFQEESPLPAVPFELAAIVGPLWPGKSFLNQDFTLSNLKAQRQRYPFQIVHLATHAEFVAGDASQSYIQFWDRSVRLDQVRELGLRDPAVQLLVLSACRTALGDPQAELGFAGLAVQSGAKSAIASLWAVSDAGTLVFMTEFYQQLKTAATRAEALRQAQLSLLRGHAKLPTNGTIRAGSSRSLPPELTKFAHVDLSHPYYWAGFTIIGNPW